MRFKEKFYINPEFDHLFEFKSEEDELRHDAVILVHRFLSEIERVCEENKSCGMDLPSARKVSKMLVSQLSKGVKLPDFMKLARLQKTHNITFYVEAIPNKKISSRVSSPSK